MTLIFNINNINSMTLVLLLYCCTTVRYCTIILIIAILFPHLRQERETETPPGRETGRAGFSSSQKPAAGIEQSTKCVCAHLYIVVVAHDHENGAHDIHAHPAQDELLEKATYAMVDVVD